MQYRSTGFTVRLGAMLITALWCATAFSQNTPVVYSSDAYVDNQVTANSSPVGEPVALNGSVHFQMTFTTDSAGVNHFSVSVANNLTGVGQKTGSAYVASDSNEYSLDTPNPSGELNIDFKCDLTSQGSAPGMSLVQTMKINFDSQGNIAGTVVQNAT